jgi:hypothetical protein
MMQTIFGVEKGAGRRILLTEASSRVVTAPQIISNLSFEEV